LAATGLADQPDALAGLQPQAEAVEYLRAARISERDVVECDRGTPADERPGLRMVAELMWLQERCDRFRHPRHVLCDIDERHRQISRGIQNGKAERADQHD